jgi:hypothetical protein
MPATAPPAAAPRQVGAGPRSYPRRPGGGNRPAPGGPARPGGRANNRPGERPKADDHEILFQKFFKSVGPRTYAAQVKRAANGNHYLVLMEGKRDEKTGEVRKTRLFVYSEDFVEFFRLVKSTAEFIKANPLPDEMRRKREKFWQRQNQQLQQQQQAGPASAAPAAARVPSKPPSA